MLIRRPAFTDVVVLGGFAHAEIGFQKQGNVLLGPGGISSYAWRMPFAASLEGLAFKAGEVPCDGIEHLEKAD